MARYKITTLSPLHIGSGEEYELNFNLLYKDGFIGIVDLLNNLMIKLFIRVMPRSFVKITYKIIRD